MSNTAERARKLKLEKRTLDLSFRRLVLTVRVVDKGAGGRSHISRIRNVYTSLKMSPSFIKVIHTQ